MTAMTLDEALEQPRDLVAAWDEPPDGSEWLVVYRVSDAGVTFLASERMVDAAMRARRSEQLAKLGVAVGAAGGDGLVWCSNPGEFRAWDKRQRVFTLSRSELRVDGHVVPVPSIRRVVTFIDSYDLGHRGVGVELRDERRIVLARERDPTRAMDPTYNQDNLLLDAAWATRLGRELAAWLGVRHHESNVALSGPSQPRSLAEQSERLAQALLEEMKRPGIDPERVEYEARKEREDRAALEAYYERTGQKVPDRTRRARTVRELRFAAALLPCPHCGSPEPAELDLGGADDCWTLSGPCPQCGKTRSYTWATEGSPLDRVVPRHHLGDERPSQIVRVGQFFARFDGARPRIHQRPDELQPPEWRKSAVALDECLLCLNELLKFVPRGMKLITDLALTEEERRDRAARRERYTRQWLQAELGRLSSLEERYAADAPRIEALERATRGR